VRHEYEKRTSVLNAWFAGKLESIPNEWTNQSEGWKESGELILYDVIEDEDGTVSIESCTLSFYWNLLL
jgi:hypothetical protein